MDKVFFSMLILSPHLKLWIRFNKILHISNAFDFLLTFGLDLKFVHQTLDGLSNFTEIRIYVLKCSHKNDKKCILLFFNKKKVGP